MTRVPGWQQEWKGKGVERKQEKGLVPHRPMSLCWPLPTQTWSRNSVCHPCWLTTNKAATGLHAGCLGNSPVGRIAPVLGARAWDGVGRGPALSISGSSCQQRQRPLCISVCQRACGPGIGMSWSQGELCTNRPQRKVSTCLCTSGYVSPQILAHPPSPRNSRVFGTLPWLSWCPGLCRGGSDKWAAGQWSASPSCLPVVNFFLEFLP